MITLLTNTDDQILRLTLDEGRQYYATPFTHYMMALTHEENSSSGVSLFQVVELISESQRVSEIMITTNSLWIAGRYRYEIYGQNSETNINPVDPSVVGLVERGWIYLIDDQSYYDIPDIDLDNDVIFNG